jgi:hypothetical protein
LTREDPAIHRVFEFEAALKSIDPSYGRFEGRQAAQLYPHALTYSRTLDELRLAAMRRQIVDLDHEVERSASAESNFRIHWVAVLGPRVRIIVDGSFLPRGKDTLRLGNNAAITSIS